MVLQNPDCSAADEHDGAANGLMIYILELSFEGGSEIVHTELLASHTVVVDRRGGGGAGVVVCDDFPAGVNQD